MAHLKLENLFKSYDGKNFVVNDANIDILNKEFTVLVGPSGCGKSTILRMIAGLESVTKGNIYIDTKAVNNIPPKDRDIAMVFQNYALYPHMTVFENMAFGLKIRKYSKEEISNRVNEASQILGLEELLNRKPKELSGGQRQRVAVGRAIVRKPKVFLFDEPLSNLDAKLRVQMRTEISKLHKKLNATIIYVTHDQVEAMTMGDRIIVLNNGVIQQVDTPLNLYNNPANKFVAGFIGSPSINLIEGKLIKEGTVKFKINKNIEFNIPSKYENILQKYFGEIITIGIRPEDLKLEDNPNADNKILINCKIELVEPLGNETFVYFEINNKRFTARINIDKIIEADQSITLFGNTDKIKFFTGSGERII